MRIYHKYFMKGDTMHRQHVRPSNDKKIFKRTAASTKTINVKPTIMRGGTRL